jgi:hypothetical protein
MRVFSVWWICDFTGVLGEMGVSTWYFDDECVVVCVVKAGKRMSYFGIRGSAEFSKFIFFGGFRLRNG